MADIRTLKAYFVGRRRTTNGNRLGFFWKFDEGIRGFAKKQAPACIGEQWEFPVDEQGRLIAHRDFTPKLSGDEASPEDIASWNAADVAAYQDDITRKAHDRLARRETDFEKALTPIRRILDGARHHDERGAIIQRVMTELWRR
jgi:hypothetical protein